MKKWFTIFTISYWWSRRKWNWNICHVWGSNPKAPASDRILLDIVEYLPLAFQLFTKWHLSDQRSRESKRIKKTLCCCTFCNLQRGISNIVILDILLYSLKQSTDHRPSAWISHLGQPAAPVSSAKWCIFWHPQAVLPSGMRKMQWVELLRSLSYWSGERGEVSYLIPL